jgi:hypothetical protein
MRTESSLKARRYSPSVSLMVERFLSAVVTAAPLPRALFYRRQSNTD